MKRRYALTSSARTDLLSIIQYVGIQRANPTAAERLAERLDEAMSLLATRPDMGHRNEKLAPLEFRFWSVGPYLIIYRPETSPLQIIRIWHGAQRTPGVV